jgi:hypothetical protein
VTVLNREEFDAIEFDAACSGDHQAAARKMSRLAVTGTQSESMPRAEAYLRAGEQWLLADDPAAAATGFRLALADGGPVFVDPRVPLARALFMLGRDGEAQSLIDRLKAEGRRDPRICDLIAELLVERSNLEGALDWATAGVEACLQRRQAQQVTVPLQQAPAASHAPAPPKLPAPAAPHAQAPPKPPAPAPPQPLPVPAQPGEDETELRLLLRLRYRIRIDLGLPEDHYDGLLDDA